MKENPFSWLEYALLLVAAFFGLLGLCGLLELPELADKWVSYIFNGRNANATLAKSIDHVGMLMVAGLALSAALGTFYLQHLANTENQLIRYAFERAESVARRLVNMAKTRANRLLREAWKASGHKDQDAESFEELRDYVHGDLPENEDNGSFIKFIGDRLSNAAKVEACDDMWWRSDFLGLLARLNTAKPDLETLADICKDISEKTKQHTNRPEGSVALNSIVERVRDLESRQQAGRESLKGALILFWLGCLLWVAATLFAQTGPKQASCFHALLFLLLAGAAYVTRLARICLFPDKSTRPERDDGPVRSQ